MILSKKVSVCICTYNQSVYLEKSIRSVIQQTLLPIEIIVSDDCSTDGTAQLLQKLVMEIPLLKVIRQPKNCGIAKNVDTCLRKASGDFIVRLDSDDYLSPTYIETLSMLLLQYPSAGYAHAAVQVIDESGNFLNKRKLFRKSALQSSTEALKASVKGYRVTANILMFRREALIKVGYMWGRPNFGEDYHLTAAISNVGYSNVYTNEILSYYRVWSDNAKTRQRRKLEEIKGLIKVFEDVIEPGFLARQWNLRLIKTSKSNLACQHANCLTWDCFNHQEKKEIASELYKFSPTIKVKICTRIYLTGFGIAAVVLSNLKSKFKLLIKSLLLPHYGNFKIKT